MPKTGTTWLQQNVFPYMEDVNYIPFTEWAKRDQLLTSELDKNKPNLYSSEGLAGQSFTNKENQITGKETLQRIKRLYPNAKIIIVFRNRESWINSMWNQFRKDGVRSNLAKNFDDFYNNYLNKELLDYKGYQEEARKLFKDVLILDFDLLKLSNYEFVKRICTFIGCEIPKYNKNKINSSWKEHHYKIVKTIGKVKKTFTKTFFEGN